MVRIVSLGNLVPVDPFSAILVDNPHLNSVLVDALYHSAVALERTTSHSNRFSHL